jgi:hypothetical protein
VTPLIWVLVGIAAVALVVSAVAARRRRVRNNRHAAA